MTNMKSKESLKHIIKEVLEEELTDLGRIHQGISTATEIGNSWNQLAWKLESTMDQVKWMEQGRLQQEALEATKVLSAVTKLLERIKPSIAKMDAIQKQDL